ncbi:ABC transporter ATP-binding protein [Rhizobium sp. CG5]|uniref:ABC transporter ATP-binding protein n=1 Tax=Rhizobium sp. CG5 TaxID=2726076 RepID=UPI0020336879|nr:ABC transporter ATP-binding protein [Rhizobium sp. CG5]MCM2474576.1 ABC transporter ATP-binding protein [Rhizobium sp. CG5]
MTEAVLEISNIVSGYGPTRIVDGVSLSLPAGGGLALLGRNGAGKTTLMCTIAGRLPLKEGSIRLAGADIGTLPASQRCRRGIGFVPQERQIFATLSVEENLRVADLGRGWSVERVYDLFPRLAERRRNGGGQLSGGEQQMLALARALMSDPVCLLLDEPFEGLAPVIVDMLLEALIRLRAESALSLIIVEQHARMALEIAEQAIIVERGRIRTEGTKEDLLGRWQEIEDMLAVTH